MSADLPPGATLIEDNVPQGAKVLADDGLPPGATLIENEPEQIPTALEGLKRSAGQLIAHATIAALKPTMAVMPGGEAVADKLLDHSEHVDVLANHAHETAINMGIQPKDEQHEVNPVVTAMGPKAVKGLRAYQAIIDTVTPAVQRLKKFAELSQYPLRQKIDAIESSENDDSAFNKAAIAPNPTPAESGIAISEKASDLGRMTGKVAQTLPVLMMGGLQGSPVGYENVGEGPSRFQAESESQARQGLNAFQKNQVGKLKADVGFAASLINAWGGTIAGQVNSPGVQRAWEGVRQYGDASHIEDVSDAVSIAMMVYGGVEAVKAAPEVMAQLRASLGPRFENVWLKAVNKERGLSIIPDEGLYNIWKNLPEEEQTAMTKSNVRFMRLRAEMFEEGAGGGQGRFAHLKTSPNSNPFHPTVPIDPDAVSSQALGAAILGPQTAEIAQTYPSLFAVANGSQPPRSVQAKLQEAMVGLSGGGKGSLMEMLTEGHFSGNASRIALSKLDDDIQIAALQDAGAHPETMGRHHEDLYTAATDPAKTAVFQAEQNAAEEAAVAARAQNTKDVWAAAQEAKAKLEKVPEPAAPAAPTVPAGPPSIETVEAKLAEGVLPEQAIQEHVESLSTYVPPEHPYKTGDVLTDGQNIFKLKEGGKEGYGNAYNATVYGADGKFIHNTGGLGAESLASGELLPASAEQIASLQKTRGSGHKMEAVPDSAYAAIPAPKGAKDFHEKLDKTEATLKTLVEKVDAAEAEDVNGEKALKLKEKFTSELEAVKESAGEEAYALMKTRVEEHLAATLTEGGRLGLRSDAPLNPESTAINAPSTVAPAAVEVKPDAPVWEPKGFDIIRKGQEKFPIPVTGFVSGSIGIHRVVSQSGALPTWSITHLPTGLRVSSEDTLEEAKALAEAIIERVPEFVEMTSTKTKGADKILEKTLKVRAEIKAALNPGKALNSTPNSATLSEESNVEGKTAGGAGKGPEPLGPEGLVQIAGNQPRTLQEVEEGGDASGAPEGPGVLPGDPVRTAEGAPPEEGGGSAGAGGAGSGGPGDEHLPPSVRGRELAQEPVGFRITPETQLEPAGEIARFNANIEAIKTLQAIEADGRLATPAEQAVLVKYVGWGQLKKAFEYWGEASWKARYETLRDLLSPEEYAAANHSTQNAHYTSREIVSSIYKAVEALGFRGGRVLEPAMGTGHFFGLLPDSMGGSSLVGVELDPITARIAKQLYQTADIRSAGFETVRLPNGYFDMVIGNPPFSDISPHDPVYNKFKYPLHDYFIVKSMDKLRDGGVMAVVTSRFSMDKANASWRDKVYEKADLLGAVRLPETAFKGNANTSVITDILFFRKRLPGEVPGDSSWLHSEQKTRGDNEYAFNRYFSEHPEMIVGEVAFKRGQYTAADFTVVHKGEIGPALDRALAYLPKEVYADAADPTKEDVLKKSDETIGVKNGGHVIKDGKVLQRVGEELVEKKDADPKRVGAMIDLLATMNETIAAQHEDAGEAAIQKAIKTLNKEYDAFVKKYGVINDKENRAALLGDPNLPRLMALENKNGAEFAKADIFSKQVIRASKKIDKMAASSDAMLAVLNEVGKVDIRKIAAMTGKTEAETVSELKGLVYQNPEGGAHEIADVYLSGNVKQKLAAAKSAAALSKNYEDNVAALEAVQPKDLEAHEVTVNIGVPWVPGEIMQAFVDHLTGVRGSIRATYAPLIGKWMIEQGRYASSLSFSVGNNETWGTAKMSAIEIIKSIIDGRQPTIWDGPAKDKIVNQPETDAVRQKMEDIEEKFKSWIFEEKERRDPLLKIYNETMNTHRVGKFDGSHMTMPGSNPSFKWRAHQLNAIFRSIVSKTNIGLFHEVGTGKTAVMAGMVMEWRRLGLAKKPMVAALNANVGAIIRDFRHIYPSAKILTFEAGELSPETRGEFMSKIATGDWDCVIVTHPSFAKLPMSRQNQLDFYRKQIVEILGAMEQARMTGEGSKSKMVKDLARAADRMKVKMEKLADKIAKDDTITFEELGVDMLVVDESQEFKNLYFPTSIARGVKGLGAGREAGRAFDMYMKTQHVSKLNNGRGVVFATGTPITNSMSEVYTLQRYLASDELTAEGLNHFDAWARTYGKIVNSFELKPSGKGYRVVQRFAKFHNVSELMRRYLQFADVVRADKTNIVLPKIAGGRTELITVPASETQKAFIESLVKRYENLKPGGKDNPLVIVGDGKKAALDMRLIDKSLPDDPNSKLNAAVNNVFKNWKAGEKKKLTQLIFCDLGVPGEDDKFNVYQDIKNKLVAFGVPKEEVAFIHDAKDDAARSILFTKANEGRIRVLIGSRTKMGIGVNVQKLLKNSHSLDIPWRPDQLEQMDGRIVRQGNTNEEVGLQQYATQNTFDTYSFQLLESKAASFAPIIKGEYHLREVDDLSGSALSYQEAKAASSGNPLIVEKIKMSGEIRKLQNLEIAHKKSLIGAQTDLAALPARIEEAHARVAGFKADAEVATKHTGAGDKFSLTVEEKTYTDRKEAGEAILAFVRANLTNYGDHDFGTYRGFRLVSPKGLRGNVILVGKSGHTASVSESGVGTLASMDSAISPDKLKGEAELVEKNIASMNKRLGELAAEAAKPFKFAGKLNELRVREKEIDLELGRDQSDKGAGDVDDDEDEDGPEGDLMFPQDEAQEAQEDRGPLADRGPAQMSDGGDAGVYDVAPGSTMERLATSEAMPLAMPELVQLAKQLLGKFPEIKRNLGSARGAFYPSGSGKIKLRADLFEDVDQAAKTLAHELGHADDYFPDKSMAHGNLLGRVMGFKRFLKDAFHGDAMNPGGPGATNTEIREELVIMSKFWRPWDRESAPPAEIKYRDSAKELYADAVSVFLNSPGTLQKMAPKFYAAFLNEMDRKPDFKAAWLGIQDLLAGESEGIEAIMERRRQDIREMGMKTDDILIRKEAEKGVQIQSIADRAQQELINRHYFDMRRVNAMEAAGVVIPDEHNPKWVYQIGDMLPEKKAVMDLAIDKILNPLMQEHGIGAVELHEYGFSNRILHDRSDIGNPHGHNPITAQENLDYLKRSLGDAKFLALKKAFDGIQDIYWPVYEEAFRLGVIGRELWDTKIIPNRGNYVTYAVQEYLEKTGFISAGIKAQTGTLKEVADTFIATHIKVQALMARNLDQQNKLTHKWLSDTDHPGEMTRTEMLRTGEGPGIERPALIPGTNIHKGVLRIWEDGRPVAYDVDPYIAEAFNKMPPAQMSLIHRVMSIPNVPIKLAYTTWNMGFVFGISPLRYFVKTWKGLSDVNGGKGVSAGLLLSEFFKALPTSYKHAIGKPDSYAEQLLKDNILQITSMDGLELDPALNSYGKKLKNYQLQQESAKDQGLGKRVLSKIIMPLRQLGHAMQIGADTMTSAWKVSAATIRYTHGENGPQMAYNVRNYAGIPFSRPSVSGLRAQTANDLFLFSNILQRHYVTALQVLVNPASASGARMKTAAVDILPGMMQAFAGLGLFGVTVKEAYKRISKYDKRHSTCIPIGTLPGGKWKHKTVFIPIPHDDGGRIIHALTYEIIMAMAKKDPKEVAAMFGELYNIIPSETPALQIPKAWLQEYTGGRYFDQYRQRTAIPDSVEKIGGLLKLERMVEWTTNSLGMTNFASYDPARRTTTETFVQMLPWINRLLKISDYGMEEDFKDQMDKTPNGAEIYALHEKKKNQAGLLGGDDHRRLSKLEREAKVYHRDLNKNSRDERTPKSELRKAARERIKEGE